MFQYLKDGIMRALVEPGERAGDPADHEIGKRLDVASARHTCALVRIPTRILNGAVKRPLALHIVNVLL